jgi:integrase
MMTGRANGEGMSERRSTGEGTVRELPDGTWWGQASLGFTVDYDERGRPVRRRRIRRSVRGQTRSVVIRKLGALREQGAGQRGAAGKTLAAFLEAWLERSRLRVRPSTWDRYSEVCHVHIIPELGKVRLERLTPDQVQRLCLGVHERGRAPRTVRMVRAVLRTALNDARRRRLIPHNPAEFVDLPRVVSQPIPALTPAGAEAILAAVDGHRIAPLVAVALGCGLRQGELLGLQWSDVDLAGASLSVRWALQRVGGRLVLVEPKTRRSRRTLPLTAGTVAALRAQRQRQLEDRLRAGSRWQSGDDLVFTTVTGGPVDGVELTRTFGRLLAGAGLPPMRWHDLRHGTASLLIAQGADLRLVMEILGHSTITLTANTYAHVSEALLGTARDALDRALPLRGGS